MTYLLIMLKAANLLLSGKELQLVSDESWIVMKEGILQKVAHLFGQLPSVIVDAIKPNLPDFDLMSIHSPKISRGERYKGLPYLILDYPREFGKDDVFAIRTMFWWAHDFSIHLHLAGEFRKRFEEKLVKNISVDPAGFHLCIHEDPWQHEVNSENYISVSDAGLQRSTEILRGHPFIKITITIPLNKWNYLDTELMNGYRKMCGLFA